MKTPSEELFYLIKSLTSQEKRFFKIYASRKESNTHCTILFDAINNLKSYDEKKLKTKLKKKALLKDFKVVKSNTYEAILTAMQQYHQNDSITVQLQRYLQDIEFLTNKQLLDSAFKLVSKAEKLAVENHQYLYLLNIFEWKRKIAIKKSNVKELKKYWQKWYLTELHYLKLYHNLFEYQQLSIPVSIYIMTRLHSLNDETSAELLAIPGHPLLKDETKALSFPAKFMRHRILGEVFLLLKDRKKSLYHYKKAAEYMEPSRLAISERIKIYSRLLIPPFYELQNNKGLVLIKNEVTSLFQSLPKKSHTNDLFNQYLVLMTNYISYNVAVFNMREALDSGDGVGELIKKYASQNTSMVHYFNRFLAYFVLTDYHRALHCCNKVLSAENTGVRGDLISFMKILNVTVHYELGNEDMLPNLCKSYYRYFEKQSGRFKAETILLDFFSQTVHTHSNKPIAEKKQNNIKPFIELRKQLESCKTENIIDIFDFISWCDSKIQNRPMAEILKEKRLKLEG